MADASNRSRENSTQQNTPPPEKAPEMAHIVERNIRSLLERQRKQEKQRTLQDKVADRVTKFTGSMTFVFLHLLLFGGWIAINLGWLPLPKFDPSFVVLAMTASVEAIFLSTFVLITQNRMAAIASARADLDLQISLLAEHEVTQLLRLVARIAENMGVDPQEKIIELNELSQEVNPEAVMDTIEAEEKRSAHQSSTGESPTGESSTYDTGERSNDLDA